MKKYALIFIAAVLLSSTASSQVVIQSLEEDYDTCSYNFDGASATQSGWYSDNSCIFATMDKEKNERFIIKVNGKIVKLKKLHPEKTYFTSEDNTVNVTLVNFKKKNDGCTNAVDECGDLYEADLLIQVGSHTKFLKVTQYIGM